MESKWERIVMLIFVILAIVVAYGLVSSIIAYIKMS